MATRNTTFKLSEEDLARLQQLAGDLRCSRTQALRAAIVEMQRLVHQRKEQSQAFVERVLGSVEQGDVLMIGLDDNLEPYATVNGQERREDLKVIGRRVASGKEVFVQSS